MAKRALVVGVNDYTNWSSGVTVGGLTLTARSLNFCAADARDFSDLLKDGFAFDEVNTLINGQATSVTILARLKRLLDGSEAGDVVCFFFSGHGGRIPEQPGDSSSRYYETIIPYDPAMISSMEIGAMVEALEPSAINFTIVLDSCHSGGMFLSPDARGFVTDQNTIQTFVDNCNTIVPWIGLGTPSAIQGNVGSLQMLNSGLCSMTVDTSKDTLDQAKATLFSACDYSQLSGESSSVGHGYFTRAIIDTVNAGNFEISHPDFLKAVSEKTALTSGGSQTPQLRGRPVRMAEHFLGNWNYSV